MIFTHYWRGQAEGTDCLGSLCGCLGAVRGPRAWPVAEPPPWPWRPWSRVSGPRRAPSAAAPSGRACAHSQGRRPQSLGPRPAGQACPRRGCRPPPASRASTAPFVRAAPPPTGDGALSRAALQGCGEPGRGGDPWDRHRGGTGGWDCHLLPRGRKGPRCGANPRSTWESGCCKQHRA